MPRVVRNFWAVVRCDDGREVATGPRRADGGIEITIYYREQGGVASRPIRLVGEVIAGRVRLSQVGGSVLVDVER